jgi:hypothetical protein
MGVQRRTCRPGKEEEGEEEGGIGINSSAEERSACSYILRLTTSDSCMDGGRGHNLLLQVRFSSSSASPINVISCTLVVNQTLCGPPPEMIPLSSTMFYPLSLLLGDVSSS